MYAVFLETVKLFDTWLPGLRPQGSVWSAVPFVCGRFFSGTDFRYCHRFVQFDIPSCVRRIYFFNV